MRQFFVVRYGQEIVGQITAPVGTPEATIRQIMIDDLWKNPGILCAEGYTPGETETMIRHGELKTYPIPVCTKPNCYCKEQEYATV